MVELSLLDTLLDRFDNACYLQGNGEPSNYSEARANVKGAVSDALTAKDARIAELEADVEARTLSGVLVRGFKSQNAELEAKVAALEERVAELTSAIGSAPRVLSAWAYDRKPFSRVGADRMAIRMNRALSPSPHTAEARLETMMKVKETRDN